MVWQRELLWQGIILQTDRDGSTAHAGGGRVLVIRVAVREHEDHAAGYVPLDHPGQIDTGLAHQRASQFENQMGIGLLFLHPMPVA